MLASDDGNCVIQASFLESAGSVDTVTCGAGLDRVFANESDQIAADCEEVERSPDPTR